MQKTVYINGEYRLENEAKVSIFDRGFLFADGIYEVVPVVNGKVLDKKPFFERLAYSLSQLELNINMSEDAISSMLETLIEKNKLQEGGIYMQVTRGVAPRNFAYAKNIPVTFVAFSFEKEIIDNPLAVQGIKVVSVEDIRWKRRDIKSIALLAQCMSKEEAIQQGAYEGWMIEDGFVTEGTSSSAYIVKENVLITRPLSNEILPGIRRKIILELSKVHNIQVEERSFTLEEALEADEAWISSATTFVLPVVELDGQSIGTGNPGTLYKKMRALYIEAALKNA